MAGHLFAAGLDIPGEGRDIERQVLARATRDHLVGPGAPEWRRDGGIYGLS